jgi:hypothetical protein
MGVYSFLFVCYSALTTPMPLTTPCSAPEYCQFTSSIFWLRLLFITISSMSKYCYVLLFLFLQLIYRSFGCTFAFVSHLDMLSCDKLLSLTFRFKQYVFTLGLIFGYFCNRSIFIIITYYLHKQYYGN